MDMQPLAGFAPVATAERMSNHGSALCRVVVSAGREVYAKPGAMVAYEGFLRYDSVPQSLGSALGEWASGERTPLMQWHGDGVLYLADYGADVVILRLDNETLSINGSHLLAVDTSLTFKVEKVKGAALAAGTGLFNVAVSGSGYVAVTSRGVPVVLDCAEAETCVDPDALVAWTTSLKIKTRSSLKMGALIGRGSGEAMQLGFSGSGFVVVQPSEDTSDRLTIRG